MTPRRTELQEQTHALEIYHAHKDTQSHMNKQDIYVHIFLYSTRTIPNANKPEAMNNNTYARKASKQGHSHSHIRSTEGTNTQI